MSRKLEWFEFSAKSSSHKSAISDGYTAKHPYAGVAVLAECSDGDKDAAERAVATVRDTFSEGVIWEPGETLQDSVLEALEKVTCSGEGILSIATIANAGENAWVVIHGGCRMLIPNTVVGVGLEPQKDSGFGAEPILIKEGTTVILLSPTLGRLVDNIGSDWEFKLKKREFSDECIRRLLNETGGKYRTSGGAVVLLGEFRKKQEIQIPERLGTMVFRVVAVFLLLLLVFLCFGNNGENNIAGPEESEVPVLPLNIQHPVITEDSGSVLPVENYQPEYKVE